MKLTPLIAIVASLVFIEATPVDQSLALRAFPNAPDGYTPANVTCPANRPSIRDGASLSSNETAWLPIRRNNTIQPMKNLLSRALNSTSFDAAGYIDRVSGNVSNLPNIAIAVSGGGYRAMLNGGGAIKAFDNRTVGSTSSGQLGGLLQSATYVSGLSGGGWLVGSVYVNNFTTISNLQSGNSGDLWQLSTSILEGPKTGFFQTVSTINYWMRIYDMVNAKEDAGFNTSITDYWGRALSFQFINTTSNDGGANFTWSSIALTSDFQNGLMPMPFLVAVGRNPGELVIGSNSTVYEFNPWEFGSFDPSIFAFAPLQYLGTRFAQGSVASSASCVRGFDNAGFVMGTSSSLFNQFILQLNDTSLPSIVKSAFRSILQKLGNDGDDIAVYAPNPFYQFNATMASIANSRELHVVDGGEDLQNIPIHPLIQPTRHVDVIFAVDSSADTNFNWPNGTSLVATYERSLNSSGIGNGTAFPSIPDVNTFVNLGLNTQPTFFGCNSSNITGPAPLVVYLPNSYYSNNSNTSTFQLAYSNAQRDAIITNGYNVVTRGNGTADSNWPSCVGCAILQRSAERTNTTLPDICNTCFNNYCWNGTLDSSTPKQSKVNTDLVTRSAAARRKLSWIGVMMALTLGFFGTL